MTDVTTLEATFHGGPERTCNVVYDDLGNLPRALTRNGLEKGKCLVVTDNIVGKRYGNRVEQLLRDAGWHPRQVTIPIGERAKSLGTYLECLNAFFKDTITVKTPVIALGGGVVLSLGAFLAATVYHGLPLVQVPTTMVGQVDAAIGGRATINHAAGKNLIGVFYQPTLVFVDMTTLASLPNQTYMEGLSEVIKYALVADRELFDQIRDEWDGITAREPDVIGPIVRRCNEIKLDVVQHDETEQGLRAILTFGHTYGHAIEHSCGMDGFPHGSAVAVGMKASLKLSSLVNEDFDPTEALELVDRLPVPDLPQRASVAELMKSMEVDRVKVRGKLVFVLLDEIGKPTWTTDVSEEQIRACWYFALAELEEQADQSEPADPGPAHHARAG